MKIKTQRSKIICTWSVIAVALAFTMSANAYQGMATPMLHINGRNLQDTSGKNVRLFGYMLPSDAYFNGGYGVNYNNPTDYTSPSNVAGALNFFEKSAQYMSQTTPVFGMSHGFYCSFVRYGEGPGWDSNGNLNSAQFNGWINNVLVPFANYCRSVGVYLVICGSPSSTNFMGAQYKANLITYWTTVASNSGIKNANNVMFEVCNEPVDIESVLGNGDWGAGQPKYDHAYQIYMNAVVSAIRNTGANNVIWVPGLSWSTQLAMFASYPISGNNIGYAGHWYPEGNDNPASIQSGFTNSWKYCTDKYPVIVTEGSWNNDNSDQGLRTGTSVNFGDALRSVFDSAGNVSWYCGMFGEVININGGPNNWTFPYIACGLAGFEWWPTYTSAAPTGSAQYGSGVTFYTDYNYGGTPITLAADNYTMALLPGVGITNNVVSSVQIPSGWSVSLYSSDNYGGTSWTLTSSTANLGSLNPSANDVMTSCKISKTGGGGGGIANGTYKLINLNSGLALDATGAQTTNGTQLEQWTYNGGNNQRWTVTSLGSSLYEILGVQSGKCVDVNGGGTANGTKVQLWTYGGGSNQKYYFNSTGGGYYEISPSHATGSCLDVNGASKSAGAIVDLWQWNGGGNQQWSPQAP